MGAAERVSAVTRVKTSARVAKVGRNSSVAGRTDDVSNLRQSSVSDDVEQVLLALLSELLVDQ